MRATHLALTSMLLASQALRAQVRAPSDGGTTASLGQPRAWKGTVGAALGWQREPAENRGLAEGRLGLYRDLMNPVVGIAGVHVEAYAGAHDTDFDGGVRARLVSPFARFGLGADYNAIDGRTRFLFSLYHPFRRGGLFHDGSILRLDVKPGRDRSVSLGVETPIYRRLPQGRTRPFADHVGLSPYRPASVRATIPAVARDPLRNARAAANWIRRLNVPYLDHRSPDRQRAEAAVVADIRGLQHDLRVDVANGTRRTRNIESEVRRFHSEVERAFTSAIGGQSTGSNADGGNVAGHARSVLLAEVLLPYNRLLGQVKKEDTIQEFANRAHGIFLRWLHIESGVKREANDAALQVFIALLEIVEENRAAIRREWGDSRFVWLPLQYALLPEEHDTQSELDALVEQAVGVQFTEGNLVSYVINEQFQYQLSRTIREAQDYHVLWTHDFRGYDDSRNPDEMAYRHVLHSYLAAMTARVRAYDSIGTFPVFMILLDEWFYQVNRGQLWMNLLEDPTNHRVRLPERYRRWEDTLAAAQDSLRAAIAASKLLQAQRGQYGERWLRNLVKVHVNVTNASDPTFTSWRLARGLPLPDNMMRDHRKLVFYDITEDDPYRGEAIYTGAGVGEHYASVSWEDRSLLVRGPAALGLKSAARNALMNQGIAASRIPYPLQPRAKPSDYDEKIGVAARLNQRPLRALGIHNETGFGSKQVNVAKAVMYTLMPPGSVINIPDSIWNGTFWGSALIGCALRGVRVLVIARALENGPVSFFGSIARSRELMWRLLTVSRLLEAEIADAGGMLKVGLFSSRLRVVDIPGKVLSVRRTFAEHEWLHQLFGFPPSVYDGLADLAEELKDLTMARDVVAEFESDPTPKLHLKANYFASREAWQLMTRPEWVAMTWEFVQQRIAQVQSRQEAVRSFQAFPDAIIDVGGGTVQNWFNSLTREARQRVVFYLVVGSQNQNARSMVSDGEDAFVVSNWPSIIPYLDLIALVGQSRWLQDPADLDKLLPPYSKTQTRLAHWFRLAF